MIQQSYLWVFIQNSNKNLEQITCTLMFLAKVFKIAQTWKKPKCPLTDEWIKKMWYTHTTTLKKKKILLFTTAWMDIQYIMLSDISQTQNDKNDKYCMISLTFRDSLQSSLSKSFNSVFIEIVSFVCTHISSLCIICIITLCSKLAHIVSRTNTVDCC